MARVAVVLIVVLFLVGCGGSKPAPTPTVVITPTSAFATSGYASGGLGLNLTDWEDKHGKPGAGPIADFLYYENGRYAIVPTDDNIWDMEVHWPSEVAIEDARTVAAALIPSDAQRIESYTPDDVTRVDHYNSRSLIDRFPASRDITLANGKTITADTWKDAAPGDFLVIFQEGTGGRYESAIIAIGDQP